MKKCTLIISLLAVLLFAIPVFANESIGVLPASSDTITINEVSYPIYKVYNSNYICLELTSSLAGKPYRFGGLKQIGPVLSHTINVDDNWLFPVRALNGKYDINFSNHPFLSKGQILFPDIELTANTIKNNTENTLIVEGTSYTYHKKKLTKDSFKISLEPQEKQNLKKTENATGIIINNIISNGKLLHSTTLSYGQVNQPLFSEALDDNEPYFPEFINKGIVKYDYSNFKKGQEVVVLQAESYQSYYIKTKNGSVKVPWSLIQIQKEMGSLKDGVLKKQIEKFANDQDFKSETKYFVWTDLTRQLTYILERKNDSWTLLKQMPCSTGKNITPTPSGNYKAGAKVSAFGMNKGYRCKYATGFIGSTYLYHSEIFDTSGSYLLKNSGTLGERASLGCIRLSVDNAKWIYDNIIPETSVLIR